MAADGLRIGEVADATGFSASTLRYYEDEGLLPPPQRTAAGHRLYSQAHLARLRFMARGKLLGLTLEEISELADAWDNQGCAFTQEQLLELLDAKLAQVHAEMAELNRFAEQLRDVRGRVFGRAAEQGDCGPDCGCAPALAAESGTVPAQRRFGHLPVMAARS